MNFCGEITEQKIYSGIFINTASSWRADFDLQIKR